MQKLIDYQIINHGYDHAQYFQGQGTAFTGFDIAVTGAGDNAKDAYEDALEQIYGIGFDTDSIDKVLPKRPKGINAKDKVPHKLAMQDDGEFYYYVSILLKVKD